MSLQTVSQPNSAKAVASSGDRLFVQHNYHDHSNETMRDFLMSQLKRNNVFDKMNKKKRGGISVPFPTKLHLILGMVEDDGFAHIISW